VSIIVKLFQPSLMFVSKARAYPIEAGTQGQVPVLTEIHLTRLERPARDKHSSLLQTLIIYGHTKICNIGPWSKMLRRCYQDFVTFRKSKTFQVSMNTNGKLKKCCLSVCPSVNVSVCLPFCPFVCMFVC
jgi:hypothetical protein